MALEDTNLWPVRWALTAGSRGSLRDRKKASAADLRTQASILQHFTREAEQGTAKCLRQTLPD